MSSAARSYTGTARLGPLVAGLCAILLCGLTIWFVAWYSQRSKMVTCCNQIKDLVHPSPCAESIGEIRHGQRSAAPSWIWGGGARACGFFDYDKPTHDTHPEIQMLGDSQFSSGVGFGSRHKDLVMATCDGATHAVHGDIDWTTLYEIAGMQDGASPL